MNVSHRFQTAAHTIPFPARGGLEEGRGRDAYCLAVMDVGVSVLIKSTTVEKVARHPRLKGKA